MISQTQLDSIGSKYTKPEWFKEILQVVEKFLWRIQMTPMNLTTIIGQKLMKNCSRSSSSIFIPMPPIKKKKCFFIKTSIVKLKILHWWIGGLPIGSTLVTLLLFLLLILISVPVLLVLCLDPSNLIEVPISSKLCTVYVTQA